MRLQDRVTIVTGGASGIGAATARILAREGAIVVIADFDEARGRAVAESLAGDGHRSRFVPVDVGDFAQVEALVRTTVEAYGRLDLLFNNAGTGHFAPLLEHEPAQYERVVRVNQFGVYHGILAAGRVMQHQSPGVAGVRGTIINTASVHAVLGSRGVIGYHASKGAVKLMTQAAALELGPLGIRCLAIGPGGVDTPIIQGYKDMGLGDAMRRQHMRGELLQPEQIGEVVAFLASDAASAINGTLVMVDDGYAAFK
jgi:NAD(P)-dependent dehydrogenase (short-subunit alcohol dehydrogenase family)